MSRKFGLHRQGGFLVIAAVFLIVVLAALVGYLMTVSTTSQAASAADLNSARAYQAARAGVEWGVYQILRNPTGTFKTTCDINGPAGYKVDLTFTSATTLSSFAATVTCTTTSASLSEGAASVRPYGIVSNACNAPTSGSCPNSTATSTTYVEREMRLTVTN